MTKAPKRHRRHKAGTLYATFQPPAIKTVELQSVRLGRTLAAAKGSAGSAQADFSSMLVQESKRRAEALFVRKHLAPAD
jgi:hypothetical protein